MLHAGSAKLVVHGYQDPRDPTGLVVDSCTHCGRRCVQLLALGAHCSINLHTSGSSSRRPHLNRLFRVGRVWQRFGQRTGCGPRVVASR